MTLTLLRKPFVFMRHGETEANAKELICGRLDWPLNAVGQAQARACQPLLAQTHWSYIAVSPALRARQTAQLALPHLPLEQLHIHHDLRERDWGDLEAQPLALHPGYEGTPPHGEPWENFVERVTHTLNAILSQHEQPLVIAHSGVWRVLNYWQHGSPQGPRIANATPMRIAPGSLHNPPSHGWSVHTL